MKARLSGWYGRLQPSRRIPPLASKMHISHVHPLQPQPGRTYSHFDDIVSLGHVEHPAAKAPHPHPLHPTSRLLSASAASPFQPVGYRPDTLRTLKGTPPFHALIRSTPQLWVILSSCTSLALRQRARALARQSHPENNRNAAVPDCVFIVLLLLTYNRLSRAQ
jgi:hypothetical protein